MESAVKFTRSDFTSTVGKRFHRIVLEYPDRLAVKSGDRSLTYNDLHYQSNSVANFLLSDRFKNCKAVALFMSKDLNVIVSIIAILKAGKIVVPLDPFHPRARNGYILSDSGSSILLSDSNNIKRAAALIGDNIDLVNVEEITGNLDAETPEEEFDSSQTGYLIYTSGTTGRPKGVMQSHRGLVHTAYRYSFGIDITPDDRHSLLSNLCFSMSLLDIFTTLLTGASLHLFDIKEQGLDKLADWLISEKITIYQSVTTIFRHFIKTLRTEKQFPDLRFLKLGGEAVTKYDFELFRKHFGKSCVFLNGFGSTELLSSHLFFAPFDSIIHEDLLPVGKSRPGVETRLIDDNDEKTAPGNIGEIVLKSPYISSGYWNRPAESEKAFIRDSADPENIVFRTGDIGKYLPDGNMIHYGRKDQQVKIRGFRVETAEIENNLLEHEAIENVAVIAQEDMNGEMQLTAFIEPTDAAGKNISGLRDFLAAILPDYMIPSKFKIIDNLPLTSSGKIDRDALKQVWISTPVWNEYSFPEEFDNNAVGRDGKHWLIFSDTTGLATGLKALFQQDDITVTTVTEGAAFGCDKDEYVINPSSEDDYRMLLDAVTDSRGLPDRIIYLSDYRSGSSAVNDPENFRGSTDHFWGLVYLARQLSGRIAEKVKLTVVSDSLFLTNETDRINPHRSILTGPCTVIPQEYPLIECSLVDIDPESESPENTLEFLKRLIESDIPQDIVSLRDRKFFTRSYKYQLVNEQEASEVFTSDGANYLITGGLGGIALEIAHDLSVRSKCRLFLITRDGFPRKDEWDNWLTTHEKDDKTSKRIRKLREISDTGTDLHVLQADVSDATQLKAVFEDMKTGCEKIDVVFHAAGVPGSGSIALKASRDVEHVMRPKIQGTINLFNCLEELPADLVVLFSSVTSQVGGVGQVDYCSANAFLDSFAVYNNLDHQQPRAISIDWDTWRDVGMAAEASREGPVTGWTDSRMSGALSPMNGLKALREVILLNEPQVVVSQRSVLNRIADEKHSDRKRTGGFDNTRREARPDLSTEYAEPTSDLEREISEIWAELLQIDSVGIDDNFFELGGHSLLMTQIMSRIYQKYQINISFADFYQKPTVADLALFILAEMLLIEEEDSDGNVFDT